MSVIKFLSHKSWHLSQETVKGVYKSLIRSLLDYISPFYSAFSQKAKKDLQIIQNNCLRVIYKQFYNEKSRNQMSTIDLHRLSNEKLIENRTENLTLQYLSDAIESKNPMVCDLKNEFYITLKEVEHYRLNTTRIEL